MTTPLLDTVLTKYRIDGDVKSSVRFLTIEDGGEDFKNQDEFIKYYNRHDREFNWLPKQGDELSRSDVGPPGEYMAKIMCELLKRLNICDTDWHTYIRDNLHRKYEHNIKYYPVGRATINSYPDWMHEVLGVTNSEYAKLARLKRNAVYMKLFETHPAKVSVVISALSEWQEVYKCLYPDLTVVPQENHLELAFTTKEKKTLAFAYFPHTRRISGSKNKRVSDLVDMLVRQIEFEKIVI